jgi:excisionase family DNA binding protein
MPDKKFPPTPAVTMTAEEIEAATEKYVEGLQDFLDRQQEAKKKPPTPAVAPRTLRTKEAAEYAGVSEWTLRQLVHAGKIVFLPGKYWRFKTTDLDKWIEAGRERRQL